MSLSNQTINIIKSTIPILEVYGVKITSTFYSNMLAKNPQLLNIFNHSNQREGKQTASLANTVLAAAKNIDKLGDILPAVIPIAHKHRALGIKPEHYPIVGENLIWAFKEVLGDAATTEILNAWGEAYGVIAQVFIDEETKLYKQVEEQTGGWKDFTPFKVIKKVKESENITSFYLQNVNSKDGLIPDFQPGQYITVRIRDSNGRFHLRHYSLSQYASIENSNTYRISVKRELTNDIAGVVSNLLHDTINQGDEINISPPAGIFVLDVNSKSPLILLSGGVGITPLFSMLNFALENQSEREINFIHTARDSQHQVFLNDLNLLQEKHKNLNVHINHSNSIPDTDLNSSIKISKIDKTYIENLFNINDSNRGKVLSSTVFICGPVSFMRDMNSILLDMGFSKDKINYEIFGPFTEI